MKRTRNILMLLFAAILALAAAIYICGDFLQVDMVVFDQATRQQQFISSTVMILLTVGLLPLALRLFRFSRVNAQLMQQGAPALLRWGSLRLVILGALLVVNTFLYYAFGFESAYGYLAVITLLCMPFVVPTMSRCQAEVTQQEKSEEQTGDPQQETDEAQDSKNQEQS